MRETYGIINHFNTLYKEETNPWGTNPSKCLLLNDHIKSFLNSNNLKCLDLGCGDGRNLIYLANMGHVIVGVDSSSRSLSNIQRKIKQNNNLSTRNIFLIKGELPKILDSVIYNKFDLILDIFTFPFIISSEHKNYFLKMYSLLNIKGLLVTQFFHESLTHGYSIEYLQNILKPNLNISDFWLENLEWKEKQIPSYVVIGKIQ